MNIFPGEIMLSSSLPNMLDLETDRDLTEDMIMITINGNTFFSTTLYVERESVTLYDLRQLVCDYMRAQGLVLARLNVRVGNYDDESVWVVYSESQLGLGSDMDFVRNHFLTTRCSYVIPRGGKLPVSFVAEADDKASVEGAYSLSVRFPDGSIKACTVPQMFSDQDVPHLISFDISQQNLMELVKSQIIERDFEVIAGSVTHGNRTLNFYFIDEEPVDAFSFTNTFNVRETFYLFGVQKIKTEFSQKEAVISGVTSYYNRSSVRKVEVETCPLTLEEAEWLNQFLDSPSIYKLEDTALREPVLLSHITSEISDSPEDKVSIKFTWQYAKTYVKGTLPGTENLFTEHFDNKYT